MKNMFKCLEYLTRLKEKLGFDLFTTSYVSDRTVKLMSRYVHSFGDPLMLETNGMLVHRLKNLYLENNCWTFLADYEWPEYECFYRAIQPNKKIELGLPASLPLNYITYKFNRSRTWKIASKTLPTWVKSHIKRAYKVE